MYYDIASKLRKLKEIQVKRNRFIVISKFKDGDGYKISVREDKPMVNGDTYTEYLKGSVIIPNLEKLKEFTDELIKIIYE